jgi:hypothetical protein
VSNILIGLILVHLAGVGVDWILTRENVVKAMLNDRKNLQAELVVEERPLVGIGRAAVVAIITLLLVGGLAAATDFSANRASLKSSQIEARSSSGVAEPSSDTDSD